MCFFFLLLNIPIQPNCQIVLILHIARSVYLPVLQTCSWLVHRKVQMMQHIDGFSAPDFGSSECVALKEVLQNSFYLCMKSKPQCKRSRGCVGSEPFTEISRVYTDWLLKQYPHHGHLQYWVSNEASLLTTAPFKLSWVLDWPQTLNGNQGAEIWKLGPQLLNGSYQAEIYKSEPQPLNCS